MATSRTELDTIDEPPSFDFVRLEENKATEPLLETKKNDNKQTIACYVIKDFQIKTQPIQKSEYPIIAFSLLAATATSSGAHDFSNSFLKNVANVKGEVYVWVGAAGAFFPQLLLSLRTNIERWSIICRSLPDITWADVRNNIKPITVTALSAAPTFKVGVDCKDFASVPALGYIVGSFRSASAIGFNSYFYTDHLQKQAQEQKKDLPIIKMLSEAKTAISHVKHEELIKVFQSNGLTTNFLKHFEDHQDPVEQTNQIIKLFTHLAEQHITHQHNPKTKPCGNATTATSWSLGFLSSMMNWKAASKVPEIFGLEVAKDILHFVYRVIEDADPKLITAFLLGGAIIGLPSWYLNFLANRKACANAFDRFCKVREEGFKKHFWDKYKDTSTMIKDWGLLFVTALFSIGLGVANGGMAYRYPFLEFEIVRIINAVSTGAVFMGLGFMSIDGFITTIEDKKDQKLLLDAFKAADLQNYYDHLASPEQKLRFIVLLKKYLHTIIDSLIGSFAKLDDKMLNDLLITETTERLPRFSQRGLFPPPPSEPSIQGEYVDILKPTATQPMEINGDTSDNDDIIIRDSSLREEAHYSFTEDNDDDVVIVSYSPSM